MKFENCTNVSELLIVGFSSAHGFKVPLYCLLLLMYIVTCLEDFVVIFLTFTSVRLHSPMYLLLSSLSICELVLITNFVPKMLHDLQSKRGSLTTFGCIVQIQIYGTAGNTITFIYALMAYDRYLAISNPLRYSSLMSNGFVVRFVCGLWLFSFICVFISSVFLAQLEFCGSNVINHYYCDFTPFIALATSDTSNLIGFSAISSTILLLVPFAIIALSYACILNTILKIPSTSGRKKTFSTCSSHLIVVSISYGSFFSIYVLPKRDNSDEINKGLSFVYTMIIPCVNPIIYTLKNQEFRGAIKAKIIRLKGF